MQPANLLKHELNYWLFSKICPLLKNIFSLATSWGLQVCEFVCWFGDKEMAIKTCSGNLRKAPEVFVKHGEKSGKTLQLETLLKIELLFKDFSHRILILVNLN